MALQGEITVQVSYKDQQQTLDLMVVDGNGPSFLVEIGSNSLH